MVAQRYQLNGAAPSYVAHLNAQGNGSVLLSPDAADGSTPAASTDAPHWRPNIFAHRVKPSQDPASASATQASGSKPGGQLSSSLLPEGSVSAPNLVSARNMRIDQPFLAAPNPVRTENLGEQVILGFRARGTRVITTLPAGQIGNDRPINIVSEQWFSPELELVMRSMHRDPWAGEFTTTVTKVSRGDRTGVTL